MSREHWSAPASSAGLTPRGSRWPEGKKDLEKALKAMTPGTTMDYGCGDGRLAEFFVAGHYIGVDICEERVNENAVQMPDRRWIFDQGQDLPGATRILFCSCLQHVPDDELRPLLKRLQLSASEFWIIEVFGKRRNPDSEQGDWRRRLHDYCEAVEPLGMSGTMLKRWQGEKHVISMALLEPALRYRRRHWAL